MRLQSKKIFLAALLVFIIQISILISLEWGLFAKKEGELPLKRFAIYGERCSGTNYLEKLIVANTFLITTPVRGVPPQQTPWHKHFMPWLDFPPTYDEDPRNSNFKEYEDTLFFVIFRNPYDWARSLHLSPHHAAAWLWEIEFTKFIRKEWVLNDKDAYLIEPRKHSPLLDIDPHTGQPFKNIFRLRNAKVKDQLRLRDLVKNIYYINYETLRDHPEKVIKELGRTFGIALSPTFQPIVEYQGWGKNPGLFKPKQYAPMRMRDLAYINSQLDRNQEKQIGYQLKKVSE